MRWGVLAVVAVTLACGTSGVNAEPPHSPPEESVTTLLQDVTDQSIADAPTTLPDSEERPPLVSVHPQVYEDAAHCDATNEEYGLCLSSGPELVNDGGEAASNRQESEKEDGGTVDESASEPTDSESPDVAYGDNELADEVIEAILDDAVERTGGDRNALEVISVEARTFNNAALGCPEPGNVYSEVITPGHQVLVRTGDTTLDYRVNGLHNTFKICE